MSIPSPESSPMHLLKRFPAVVALAALASTACYRYVPAAPEPVRGTPVRAHLSRPLDVRMHDVTANNVARVDGEVVSVAADSLYLSASRLVAMTGYDFLGRGETVVVPRPVIASLEERRIDSRQTGIAIVAGVLAAALAHFALGEAGVFGREREDGSVQPR